MDSKKNSIRYLIHLLLIIFFIFTINQLMHSPEPYRWEINAWLYYVFRKAGIAFGMLLALEYLHNERERTGTWKINPYRLLILGVPALVFSFKHSVTQYFGLDINVVFFEIMFGYILATSVYKEV